MRLYHFTSWFHYLEILEAGEITTTESNIGSGRPDWSPCGEHVGPDVVWLTSHGEPTRQGFVEDRPLPIEFAKTHLSLTVDFPDDEPQRWFDFSKQNRIHPKWRRILESENKRAPSWWVVERPVRADEIVEVIRDDELTEYFRSTPGSSELRRCGKGS